MTVKQADYFEFNGFNADFEMGRIEFDYKIGLTDGQEETFKEIILLPEGKKSLVSPNDIQSLLQSLHLMLGISYWKLYCPKEIRINGYSLSKEQAEFWDIVYTKGLGEFFYKNQIDYRGLVKFPYDSREQPPGFSRFAPQPQGLSERALIPIGGGKDSIVSVEIVKQTGIPFDTWYSTYSGHDEAIKAVFEKALMVKRTLDPKMVSLSQADAVYKGHIPPTAINSFLSLLLGTVYGYRYLIFSNERSSNYGNVDYLEEGINHQWSKSKEFEDLFRAYAAGYITPAVSYFSLLRPFYEIEIAKRFCQYPQYFHLFTSCNRNFRINNPLKDKKWCGECPKCAFVFCLMSAFLPKDKLVAIFGENLFSKESLLDTYRQLLGIKDIKPFECVGTPEEVKVAFYLSHKRGEYNEDQAMQMFVREVLPELQNLEKMKAEVFSMGNEHNIPKEFKNHLKPDV